MLSRYRKLNGVMPLSAAEIEDNTIKLMSFIFFYLHLTSSISFYLQRKLKNK